MFWYGPAFASETATSSVPVCSCPQSRIHHKTRAVTGDVGQKETQSALEGLCKYIVLLSELGTVMPRGGLPIVKGADRQSLRLCQKKKVLSNC